ncbi:MAG: serine/threonine protein kinase, partial [Rubrivivax sp.]|nr:serine/threonine protein kinase [Rubrivivax sp.]
MRDGFKLEPHEWAQLRALLDQALDLPAAERDDWLAHLDPSLAAFRPRLRSLLAHAADNTTARRMESLPRVETADFAHTPGGTQQAVDSTFIGPYRLLRELGSGGMASVWLAERTDMLQRRQVALKLPHGAWRRAGLAERMSREREILATLQHPNIATLYDAGFAEDGQPYLALEYVEGERIDQYCKRLQLGVSATLRLFLQVVRAVSYAHSQLVVHRDLKPSNILVTAAGEAKLLDFGIAKLLDQGSAVETELTQQSGRALTPDYAAPEQILGRPVGTPADVYALGVVLFELLAGARPYVLERGSRAALEDAIVQTDAPRPSSLAPSSRRKALQGDLDTIVLKALKKDPAQRYATADALAEDIERYLEHRPVMAQADSRWYRAQRFVGRNRLAVAAATLVLSAVVAGAGVSVWQAWLARQEQARAEEVKNFVASIFKEANPFQQGSGKALTGVELLRLARDKLGEASIARPQTRVELLTLLGSSLLSLEDAESA